jgi:hypothetical protein
VLGVLDVGACFTGRAAGQAGAGAAGAYLAAGTPAAELAGAGPCLDRARDMHRRPLAVVVLAGCWGAGWQEGVVAVQPREQDQTKDARFPLVQLCQVSVKGALSRAEVHLDGDGHPGLDERHKTYCRNMDQ